MAEPLDLAAIEQRQLAWAVRSDPARHEAATIILEDVPALVARVRALEAVVAELRQHTDGCHYWKLGG
jgi:hypothetical protein